MGTATATDRCTLSGVGCSGGRADGAPTENVIAPPTGWLSAGDHPVADQVGAERLVGPPDRDVQHARSRSAVPVIRLPSGASTWTRPGDRGDALAEGHRDLGRRRCRRRCPAPGSRRPARRARWPARPASSQRTPSPIMAREQHAQRSAAPRPLQPLSRQVVRIAGRKGSTPRHGGSPTRGARVASRVDTLPGRSTPARRPSMSVHPRAGTPADSRDLIDVPRVVLELLHRAPGSRRWSEQRVAFGTSGHRGSSLRTAFNEDHIAATSQAIVEYRRDQGTDGPLFLGRDTHALSEPAMITRAGGLRRQRRDRADRQPRRLHPDAGAVARDPRPTTGAAPPAWPTASWSPRRTTRRTTAASSTTRRTAARPTPTPPSGSRTGRTR